MDKPGFSRETTCRMNECCYHEQEQWSSESCPVILTPNVASVCAAFWTDRAMIVIVSLTLTPSLQRRSRLQRQNTIVGVTMQSSLAVQSSCAHHNSSRYERMLGQLVTMQRSWLLNNSAEEACDLIGDLAGLSAGVPNCDRDRIRWSANQASLALLMAQCSKEGSSERGW